MLNCFLKTYYNLRIKADTTVNLLPDANNQTIQGRGLHRTDFRGDLLALRKFPGLGLDLARRSRFAFLGLVAGV